MKKRIRRMTKRILAIICAAGVVCTSVPMDVYATEQDLLMQENTEETAEEVVDDKDTEENAEGASDEKNTEETAEDKSDEKVTEETTEEASDEKDTEETAEEASDETDTEDVSDEKDTKEITENVGGESVEETEEFDAFQSGYNPLPEEEETDIVDENIVIPNEEGVSFLSNDMEDEVPAYYITNGAYIPGTRNQSPYGTCWAHSCMALAEIDMLKNHGADYSSTDFSELQLAYFGFNSVVDPLGGTEGDDNFALNLQNVTNQSLYNRGGNLVLAQNVLASWVGAADEKDVPYSLLNGVGGNKDVTVDSAFAYKDVVHLQNYYMVRPKENRELAKRMLMKYGAMGISYKSDSSYYSSTYNSFYYPTQSGTNHAITVVGWDDNFSKDKFASSAAGNGPEGDGAWLVRNSWRVGTAYSDEDRSYNTYFWMSYYDHSLATTGYFFDFESADNYDHNYQYDGGMYSGSVGYTNGISAANVFTAKACEKGEFLEAVGVLFNNAQTPYTIKVYTNLTDETNPESGTLVSSATAKGVSECEGFYTVALNDSVYLQSDEKFAVVVDCEQSLSGTGASIGTEREYSDTSTSAWFGVTTSAKAGQSFIKALGSSMAWNDYGVSNNRNLRIKAYTKDVTEEDAEPTDIILEDLPDEPICLGVEEEMQIGAKVIPRNAIDRKLVWSSSDESVVAVDEKGMLTGLKAGTATITVKCENYDISKSFEVKVSSELQSIKITGLNGAKPVETLRTGQYSLFSVVYTPKGTTDDKTVTWSVSDSKIATVDENGKVTALAAGYVYLTAKVGTVTDRIKLKCLLGIPVIDQIDSNGTTVNLRWQKDADVQVYELRRKLSTQSNEFFKTIKTVEVANETATEIKYADTDLSNGLKYHYALIAKKQVTFEGDDDEITEESTLYSVTVPYLITYHYNEGEPAENDLPYYYPGTAYTLQEPSRVGYQFEGWFLDEAFQSKIEKITTSTTGNLELYAKWKKIAQPITYELQQGINSAKNPATYEEGKEVTLYEPTREGYLFGGWYLDSVYTKSISKIATTSRGPLTLYAKWDKVVLRVNYHLYGAKNAVKNKEQFAKLTTDFYLDDPVSVNGGYQFGGWYTDETFTNRVTAIMAKTEGTLDLYAKWNPLSYSVRFHANAPEAATVTGNMPVQNYCYGEVRALPKNTYKCNGYTFMGWAKTQSTTQISFVDAQVVAPANGKLENDALDLYAVWSNILTLKYVTNGGTIASGDIQRYWQNSRVTLPVPTRNGYTFAGWYTDNNTFKNKVGNFVAKQSGTIQLYAKWTENTYQIVFDGNGSQLGKQPKLTLKYTDLSKKMPANNYVRKGYQFTCWRTNAGKNGEFISYAAGGELDLSKIANIELLPAKNQSIVKVFAIWSPTQYTIKYELNGGSLSNAKAEYHYGEQYVLPTPVRNGYTFAGWYRDANCTKAIKEIKNSDYGNIAVYAKWATEYSVEFYDINPVSSILNATPVKTQPMKYEQAKALLRNSVKYTGYHFDGWAVSEEEAKLGKVTYADGAKVLMPEQIVSSASGAKVLKLYAVWNNKYIVRFIMNDDSASEKEMTYTYGTGIPGTSLQAVMQATKQGYHFAGWYADANFKKKVTVINAKSATDMVLYAKWAGDAYWVYFYGMGKENIKLTGRMDKQKLTVGGTAKLKKNQYKMNGYDFKGWSYSSQGALTGRVDVADSAMANTISKLPTNGAIGLCAVWQPKAYAITYQNMTGFETTDNPTRYTIETSTIVLKNPTRVGYTFVGWYSDKKMTKRVYRIEKGSTGNKVLYAKWILNR